MLRKVLFFPRIGEEGLRVRKSSMKKWKVILSLGTLLLISCIHYNPDHWTFLGLEDKPALRLVLAEPYLYACAGAEGLWRMNILGNSDWKYLGLADTTLTEHRGVQDVVIDPQNSERILVVYNTAPDPTKHCVYRSLDGGENWEPADSGLEFYWGEERYFKGIDRFLQYQDFILGAGEGVYKTQTFGEYWQQINTPGLGGEDVVLKRHPIQPNIIWIGGNTTVFTATLGFSIDSGSTWESASNLSNIVRLHTNGVQSIAFDANHPNVVYVALASDLIKTTDMGESWIVLDIKGIYEILSDPGASGHLWVFMFKDTSQLMETWDGGSSWQPVDNPITTNVRDMIWDDNREVLFIGTLHGVWSFKP